MCILYMLRLRMIQCAINKKEDFLLHLAYVNINIMWCNEMQILSFSIFFLCLV